jgi:hypothetical protein
LRCGACLGPLGCWRLCSYTATGGHRGMAWMLSFEIPSLEAS